MKCSECKIDEAVDDGACGSCLDEVVLRIQEIEDSRPRGDKW